MKRFKYLFIFIICLGISCGIEDNYFLPQVPGSIVIDFNTGAIVDIPPIHPDYHHYATGYSIFYKIYLSSESGGTISNINMISSTLVNDYNAFYPLTDPTNISSNITINSFSNRRYYELNNTIPRSGGILNISFPAEGLVFNPNMSLNNGTPSELLRSNLVMQMLPSDEEHEPYFRNTSDLNDSANAVATVNADVASGQTGHAYAAMYIVAIGQNPQNFSRIFSNQHS